MVSDYIECISPIVPCSVVTGLRSNEYSFVDSKFLSSKLIEVTFSSKEESNSRTAMPEYRVP